MLPGLRLFVFARLPGFFTLGSLNAWDILAIISISAFVPMLGNLGLALFLDRARALLQSPAALRRLNIAAGVMLIAVALLIPFL